jgi:hypothetical protein
MRNIKFTLNKWTDYFYESHPQIITNITIKKTKQKILL